MSEIEKVLVGYIRQYLFANWERPKAGIYRASVISQSCLRSKWNYYKHFERNNDLTPDMIMLLGGGIVFHRMLQGIRVNGKRFWDAVEVPCKTTEKMGDERVILLGHADAMRNGIVYEFKHTRSQPRKAWFNHLLQLNFYLKALQKPEGRLVYVSYREDGGLVVKDFQLIFSESLYSFFVNRAQELHIALKSPVPPRCSCRGNIHEFQTI